MGSFRGVMTGIAFLIFLVAIDSIIFVIATIFVLVVFGAGIG